MDVKVWTLSLFAGMIVGVLFTLIKLPLPAPPVLSGVLGIVGVWLGAQLVDWVKGFWS